MVRQPPNLLLFEREVGGYPSKGKLPFALAGNRTNVLKKDKTRPLPLLDFRIPFSRNFAHFHRSCGSAANSTPVR
jgi:hypothetical protein